MSTKTEICKKLSNQYGVHVEYNEFNKEYIVNCVCAGNTAQEAEQEAKKQYSEYDFS